MKVLLNIGTHIPGTDPQESIRWEQIESELLACRLIPVRKVLFQSDSEPTYFIEAEFEHGDYESLKRRVYWAALGLKQDAIAFTVGGFGNLAGPNAAAWYPFNPEYFTTY